MSDLPRSDCVSAALHVLFSTVKSNPDIIKKLYLSKTAEKLTIILIHMKITEIHLYLFEAQNPHFC